MEKNPALYAGLKPLYSMLQRSQLLNSTSASIIFYRRLGVTFQHISFILSHMTEAAPYQAETGLWSHYERQQARQRMWVKQSPVTKICYLSSVLETLGCTVLALCHSSF